MLGNADILGLAGVAQRHAGYHSIFVHRGLGPPLGSSTHAPGGTSFITSPGAGHPPLLISLPSTYAGCLFWLSWFVRAPAPVPRGVGRPDVLGGSLFLFGRPSTAPRGRTERQRGPDGVRHEARSGWIGAGSLSRMICWSSQMKAQSSRATAILTLFSCLPRALSLA